MQAYLETFKYALANFDWSSLSFQDFFYFIYLYVFRYNLTVSFTVIAFCIFLFMFLFKRRRKMFYAMFFLLIMVFLINYVATLYFPDNQNIVSVITCLFLWYFCYLTWPLLGQRSRDVHDSDFDFEGDDEAADDEKLQEILDEEEIRRELYRRKMARRKNRNQSSK